MGGAPAAQRNGRVFLTPRNKPNARGSQREASSHGCSRPMIFDAVERAPMQGKRVPTVAHARSFFGAVEQARDARGSQRGSEFPRPLNQKCFDATGEVTGNRIPTVVTPKNILDLAHRHTGCVPTFKHRGPPKVGLNNPGDSFMPLPAITQTRGKLVTH